jgi:hypothetical protein
MSKLWCLVVVLLVAVILAGLLRETFAGGPATLTQLVAKGPQDDYLSAPGLGTPMYDQF